MQSLRDIHSYKVIEAWHLFHQKNIILEGVLRTEIELSWKVCKDLGINPWRSPPEPASVEEIEWHQSQYAEFIRAAQPMMQYLFATNSQLYSDNVVSLISAQGMFISEIKRPRLKQFPISVGTFCIEEIAGTCAGAIVIKEKKPFVLGGYESYMVHLQSVFAGGAPIFKSDGELLGLIGIFNAFGKIPEQPLAMLINAASIIENSLDKNHSDPNPAIENDPAFKAFINNAKQNIFLINNDGYIVNVSDQCADLLYLPVSSLIGKHYKELGIELDHLLGKEANTRCEHFEIKLNNDYFPCISNNCTEIYGNNGIEHYLLLFSEDTARRKVARKQVNVSVDVNTLSFQDIIGDSDIFMTSLHLAQRSAQVDAPVLIEGESGTGKEVFAHAIHNNSPRKNGPFIAVNCGAIQPSLMQSELFGYEEGSFTGAVKGGKAGKFELADEGTLFLDEIGEMPLDMQVNLLRVLQDKSVTRVGGSKSKEFNVRIIAATNADILDAVTKGIFRKDLYYRLNVINIKLPPLRERKEDIPLLANYFAQTIAHRMGMERVTITNETISILQQYQWPGNVRELSNVIENSLIFTTNNMITPDLLPKTIIKACENTNEEPQMEKSERDIIIETLKLNNGNKSKTARDLGITRNTLYRRMDRLHID